MRRSRIVGAVTVACMVGGLGMAVAATGAPGAQGAPGPTAPPGLSITDVTASEGSTGTTSFVFTVRLSTRVSSAVTVAVDTVAGTATSPDDFGALHTTVTIPRKKTSATVAVGVVGDTTVEPDEAFFVRLSSASSNAAIVDGEGVGTVVNDDSGGGGGGGDPVVAAAGDIACDPADGSYNGGSGTSSACRQLATSDLLVGGGYAAVLTLGDNQYENGALTAFDAAYQSSWGRVLASTHPAPGNHDYNTAGASGYYSYFGAAAGDPSKGYYSYDVGQWHLIALNSNCGAVSCSAGSTQETWLRADLVAHPAACTLAYWHHPRFSSGSHGDNTAVGPLFQALYEGNADLVLVGHDHDYERFAPQSPTGAADATRGVREIVVGTGGRSLYAWGTVKANSERRINTTFGVLRLTLHPAGYDWSFLPAGGGAALDSGSGACH